ncbi:MAG: hypothetical protein MJK10_01115 [Pseudomonadales bacterium]|nr:hypothetical protein [Pseudomonadales bacterium]NRA14474.1 hypothetical protein [Oceanospirillaceae bacterium]
MKGVIALLLSMLPITVQAEVNIRAHYGDWDYFKDNTGMTYTTDAEGNHIALIAKLTLGVMTVQIIEIFAPRCTKSITGRVREASPIRIGKQWMKVQEYCTNHGSVTITPFMPQTNQYFTQLLKSTNSVKLYNSKDEYWITFSGKGFTRIYKAIMDRAPKNVP